MKKLLNEKDCEIRNSKRKRNLKKGLKFLKGILFIIMIIMSYLISDKLVDYVSTLDIILVKRILNIIFVVILMFLAMYKNNKEN